jgi:hypothetical protein
MDIPPVVSMQSEKIFSSAIRPAFRDDEGHQQSDDGKSTDIDEQDGIDEVFEHVPFNSVHDIPISIQYSSIGGCELGRSISATSADGLTLLRSERKARINIGRRAADNQRRSLDDCGSFRHSTGGTGARSMVSFHRYEQMLGLEKV